jgi:hypothetical protein
MSATNHDPNTNIHGINEASRKGYCFLYFFMFLALFIGAVYMTMHGNMNGVPMPK